MIVVEAVAPELDAWQLLATLLAVNGSEPEEPTDWMLVELVTDPDGPTVPWVLTLSAPELKKVAGPFVALPDGAVAVIGPEEPDGGRVTVGVGPLTLGAPPNKPTLLK